MDARKRQGGKTEALSECNTNIIIIIKRKRKEKKCYEMKDYMRQCLENHHHEKKKRRKTTKKFKKGNATKTVKMFGKLSTGEEEEGKTRRFAAKVKMFVKPPSGLQREQLRLRAGFCLRNIFVTFFQRRINDNIYLMVIHLC